MPSSAAFAAALAFAPGDRPEAPRLIFELGVVGGVAVGPVEDRVEGLAVPSREDRRMTSRHFRQRPCIGDDRRAALCQGLHGREAVAFVVGGQYRRIGVAVKVEERIVIYRRVPEEPLAVIRMGLQRGKQVVSHPALPADDDESSVLGLEPVERFQQERVVLARLDGADREEVAEASKLGERRRRRS